MTLKKFSYTYSFQGFIELCLNRSSLSKESHYFLQSLIKFMSNFYIYCWFEEKCGKNYYIILIFQHYFFQKMQGLYNAPFNTPTFYQHTHQLFDLGSSNPTNQEIVSLLMGHRQMIQKLLENQNTLKAQIKGPQRTQTTDSEHSHDNCEFQQEIPAGQVPQIVCKTINTILIKQEKQCITMEKDGQTRGIQIICSCPIQQKVSVEQFQQRGQIKQLQKHPEQMKKCCETKNIIKNYGKSILMFLRRNRTLVKKVLDQFQYDQNQFYSEFEKFRDRVNSITELKMFWTEEGNRFAKIYRIISNIYLKRYSLKHTFSSRVKNYGVHIKYRKRLLDVLKNPADFSSIKYL